MTDQREAGRALMVRVLGQDYMDRRDASTNDFNAPLRQLSEEVAFGNVWQRPPLTPKLRSMLCLALLTALKRPHEIRVHVNSSINNGCTLEEIREVLLHTVLYCGLPATIDAMRVAEEVLKERGLLT